MRIDLRELVEVFRLLETKAVMDLTKPLYWTYTFRAHTRRTIEEVLRQLVRTGMRLCSIDDAAAPGTAVIVGHAHAHTALSLYRLYDDFHTLAELHGAEVVGFGCGVSCPWAHIRAAG